MHNTRRRAIKLLQRLIATFLTLLFATTVSAQGNLHIAEGTSVHATGGVSLVLDNTSITNNGSFSFPPSGGLIKITGASGRTFAGNALTLDRLQLQTTGPSELELRQDLHIVSEVLLTSGNINLRNHRIFLSENALVNGQSDHSRLYSNENGFVQITRSLNNPSGANPGNLGAVITSSKNLGPTTVRLGFAQQFNNRDRPSIRRNYTIQPTNNMNLHATLQFRYLDAELNGLNEFFLTLWHRRNNNWTQLGHDSRDANQNIVSKGNLNSLTSYTLFAARALVFVIFPNPATDFIFLKFDWLFDGPIIIYIYASNSTLVKSQTLSNMKGVSLPAVRVKELPDGAYTIKVVSKSRTMVSRFIKFSSRP